MTRERDIDRILDLWFAERPTEVPDRVLDEVAERIGRRSQQPAWLTLWRDSHVNTYLKITAAVAAVLIVAVVGWNLLPSSSPSIGGSGPTAVSTPSPAPTPPVVPLPDGRLEARDYVAKAFPGDPMDFTITAPDGWTGFGEFFLAGPQGSDAPDGVGISLNHDPIVVSDPCDSSAHPQASGAPAQSVDDLVAALSARTDLVVSGITDTGLAGYSGKRLDLQLPASSPCSNHYVFAEPKGLYSNGSSNRWRVWILDIDGDTAVVVLLDYAATPEADRAAAEAAIDSIRITP